MATIVQHEATGSTIWARTVTTPKGGARQSTPWVDVKDAKGLAAFTAANVHTPIPSVLRAAFQ